MAACRSLHATWTPRGSAVGTPIAVGTPSAVSLGSEEDLGRHRTAESGLGQ